MRKLKRRQKQRQKQLLGHRIRMRWFKGNPNRIHRPKQLLPGIII